jgi:type II secretory pathway predicted ATPase ExeA
VSRQQIPGSALISLRQQLDLLPARCRERKLIIQETANLYGISEDTLYRLLREQSRPKSLRRADRGQPRKLSQSEMESYCEVIAAFKIRTSNKKGRHLSTTRAIELLEEYGVDTPHGFVQPQTGLLTKTTVNRYLKAWGYDQERMTRQPPAVRFQADDSNDCWHFDLSPSDLKHIAHPAWVEPGRGNPLLMLYSVVDDRSGMCYQEYHCVYGENVEAALRFLFNAMTAKTDTHSPFQGIPAAIYADNGPISKSQVFQNVLSCLDIKLMTHMPKGSDGRRVTARSKGKVERPFRTVKEAHETLYHFHEPSTEVEANQWLHQYLLNYNDQPHRAEPHSRLEDWLQNIPKGGLRAMCSWERFCTFAREPQRRKVGGDARVSVEGIAYEVDPDLAGETVILWWGLFDNELYVERDEQRYGPFYPVDGPIPLHRYRKFKKTRTQERADRIATLAKQLDLPRAALTGNADLQFGVEREPIPGLMQPFQDPDPYREFTYPTTLMAKLAIADYLGQPLAKLSVEQREFIAALVEETLTKKAILERVRQYFQLQTRGERMLTEVMTHFGLVKEFRQASYYETTGQKQLFKDLKDADQSGSLVALTGVIGCGKTTTLRRLFEEFSKENKILVSKSLSVDKNHTTLTTLISALFYDLSPNYKETKIPSLGEKRERELRDLIKKGKKPVVLFVDEAHDLQYHTLKGLKRLIEVIEDGGETLSVVLAGHPKLKNDLRRPTMEEIGYRATILTLEGMVGSQREYINWLIKSCTIEGTETSDILTIEAIEILSEKLRTPLQIHQHLR